MTRANELTLGMAFAAVHFRVEGPILTVTKGARQLARVPLSSLRSCVVEPSARKGAGLWADVVLVGEGTTLGRVPELPQPWAEKAQGWVLELLEGRAT